MKPQTISIVVGDGMKERRGQILQWRSKPIERKTVVTAHAPKHNSVWVPGGNPYFLYV